MKRQRPEARLCAQGRPEESGATGQEQARVERGEGAEWEAHAGGQKRPRAFWTFLPGRRGSIAVPVASGLACECDTRLNCGSDATPVPGLGFKETGVFLHGLLEP